MTRTFFTIAWAKVQSTQQGSLLTNGTVREKGGKKKRRRLDFSRRRPQIRCLLTVLC
jgi:hypothetical protein